MKQIVKRRTIGALALAALAAIGLVVVVAASASAVEVPTACATVSKAFVQKTVGLPHSALLRDVNNLEETSSLEPSELPFAFHSECGVGLWSGAAPKGPAASLAKGKLGKAAQVGVDVWAPDTESPNVEKWEEDEYAEVLGAFQKGRFQLLIKLPGRVKPINPKGDGYSGSGITIKASGPAQGLEAAAGCWWTVAKHRIVCLFTEEADGKPVVDHLNKLASKIVPNFLGAP